jgi:hypothetical protein
MRHSVLIQANSMTPYLATLLTFAIAIAFLRLMDFFAHRGVIGSKLSRKLIHIGTGPIFVLCWLMFLDVPSARYLAVSMFPANNDYTLQVESQQWIHHAMGCGVAG